MARRAATVACAVALCGAAVVAVAFAPGAGAYTSVPYDGPEWMPRVAVVGDSLVYTTQPEIKGALRANWWRDSIFSYPGVRVSTMREQIWGMAGEYPEAFVVSLGGNDVLPLITGEWDWAYEKSQIDGVFSDLLARGIGCIVWVGPNQDYDHGGQIDYWTTRINAEIKAQMASRGIGVFADWTAAALGHPEYFLADGSHFTDPGKAAFSSLVTSSLRQCTQSPKGSLDAVSAGFGAVRVQGWSFDPDTRSAISVRVTGDGATLGTIAAGGSRPDIGATFPVFGANHGFDAMVPLGSGTHRVCAFGVNVGPYGYRDTPLGCRTVTIGPSPGGSFDVATGTTGGARVQGWVADPDAPTGPIDAHVYVDSKFAVATTAGGSRTDVARAFPWMGATHGFDVNLVGLAPGSHDVCIFAINASGTPGTNPLIGCRSVTTTSGDPRGSFDALVLVGSSGSTTTMHAQGWALDPETTASIDVQISVDGVVRATGTASTSRPDVGRAFPGYGDLHGFDLDVGTLSAGSHAVCAVAHNAPGTVGTDVTLGCARVSS